MRITTAGLALALLLVAMVGAVMAAAPSQQANGGAALSPAGAPPTPHNAAPGPKQGTVGVEAPLNVTSTNATALNTTSPVLFRDMTKSKADNRDYGRFSLPNGLDVIVVSDPQSTKAAAAMDVGVGHWSDPEDIPGLAHFCEHMLFLGTKKYPQEDEYSAFLASHGGSSNAFTSTEDTNFYFDVQPEYLHDMLDRFAQFFVEPLFTESSTGRERNAVDSEHSKNLQSDSWRTFMLIQSLGNTSLPFHKFGTGNKDTLGIDEKKLHDALVAFWKEHYFASNMRLSVVGKNSVEELQKWVEEKFSNLPRGSSQEKVIVPRPFETRDLSSSVMNKDVLGSILHVETVTVEESVTLLWFIPPQSNAYGTKSTEFISNLIGDESVGSLAKTLKELSLATSVEVGVDSTSSMFDMFQIDIDLTKKGMQDDNLNKVVSLVFEAIRLVEQGGINKWRWDEMAKIAHIKFDTKNKENAQDYVSDLAKDLAHYQREHILSNSAEYHQFDSTRIQSVLSKLTPANALVVVSSSEPKVPLSKTEKWYGTKYNLVPANAAWKSAWESARTSTPSTLQLPEENRFIPRSIAIKDHGNDTHLELPSIIVDAQAETAPDSNSTTGSHRFWWKQDTRFNRPHAHVLCKLWGKAVYDSPRDVVLSSLYARLVDDALSTKLYPARSVGYEFDVGADVDGINFMMVGFDDGIKEVAKIFASHLNLDDESKHPAASRFAVMKEELLEHYNNFKFKPPHFHAAYDIALLLENPHWDIEQYKLTLPRVTLADVIEWSHTFYSDAGLECLITGNLRENEALDVAATITNEIKFYSNFAASRLSSNQPQRIVKLEGEYTFFGETPNVEDSNSVSYVHYQHDKMEDVVGDVMFSLLSSMMEKPAFHQLRTVEQLGYIVWSGDDCREGVPGMRVIVQSATRSGEYLTARIYSFLNQFRDTVHNMKAEDFEVFLNTFKLTRSHKPRTLRDLTSRQWGEISSQQYLFHRRLRELSAAMHNVTQPAFVEFVDHLFGFDGTIPNRLTVQLSAAHHAASNATHEGNPEAGKAHDPSRPKGGSNPNPPINVPKQTESPHSFLELAMTNGTTQEHVACPTSANKNTSAPADPRCVCTAASSAQSCGGWTVKTTVLKPNTTVAPITVVSSSSNSSSSSSSCECSKTAKASCCEQPKKESVVHDNVCQWGPRRVYEPIPITLRNINAFKSAHCSFPLQRVGSVKSFLSPSLKSGSPAVPVSNDTNTHSNATSTSGWNYAKAGADWTGLCVTGKQQSPIDIKSDAVDTHHSASEATIVTSYPPMSGAELANLHHRLVVAGEWGTAENSGTRFMAIQTTFHAPSEHTFDGKRFPAEMQIVHQKEGAVGKEGLMIISVLFENGAENAFLKSIGIGSSDAPKDGQPAIRVSETLNLKAAFQSQLEGPSIAYIGSLTTPTCDEGVEWHVLTSHATLSAAQADAIRAANGGANNRAVQSIGTRKIYLNDVPPEAMPSL